MSTLSQPKRAYQIASDAGISVDDLVIKAKGLGIEVKNKMSLLDAVSAARVIAALREQPKRARPIEVDMAPPSAPRAPKRAKPAPAAVAASSSTKAAAPATSRPVAAASAPAPAPPVAPAASDVVTIRLGPRLAEMIKAEAAFSAVPEHVAIGMLLHAEASRRKQKREDAPKLPPEAYPQGPKKNSSSREDLYRWRLIAPDVRVQIIDRLRVMPFPWIGGHLALAEEFGIRRSVICSLIMCVALYGYDDPYLTDRREFSEPASAEAIGA